MSALQSLAHCIGQPLEAIHFESMYVDGAIVEVYRTVFFRFDSWFRVVSKHGETRVDCITQSELRPYSAKGEHPQYPINEVTFAHAVGPVLGCELLAASEIVSAHNSRLSYGFQLEFESHRLRLLSIDGESMDLSAGRSQLGEEYARRPLLRVIRGGVEDAET